MLNSEEPDKDAIYDEEEDVEVDLGEEDVGSDDEWDLEDDENNETELYDSKIDHVDEILYVQEQFGQLQQTNGEKFNSIFSLMSQDQQNELQGFFQIA